MPLLLVDGAGRAYVGEGGLMLGLTRARAARGDGRPARRAAPPLLFTDGLVEDRDVLLDDNLEKLRAAAAGGRGADVEAFANHVMSVFGPREDDVAMIAVRRTETGT